MRCIGVTKGLKRCKNLAHNNVVCSTHKWLPFKVLFITIPTFISLYYSGIFKIFENPNKADFKRKQIEAVLSLVNESKNQNNCVKLFLKNRYYSTGNWIKNDFGVYESCLTEANYLNFSTLFRPPLLLSNLLVPKMALMYVTKRPSGDSIIEEGVTKHIFDNIVEKRFNDSFSVPIVFGSVYFGTDKRKPLEINVYYPREIAENLSRLNNIYLQPMSLNAALNESKEEIVVIFPSIRIKNDIYNLSTPVYKIYDKNTRVPLSLGDYLSRLESLRNSIIWFLNQEGISFDETNFPSPPLSQPNLSIDGIIDTNGVIIK